jgi:hypothetical protein
MSYGFDQAFRKLNDLRMYIATVGNAEDKETAIKTLMDDPGVKTLNAGVHKVFKTQPEYSQKSAMFHEQCRLAASLNTAGGQNIPMGSRFTGHTCVVVGAGEGMDAGFVRKAREAGAIIIALGNAIHLYNDPDFWVAVRRPPAYVNEGFVSPKVTGIYPDDFKQHKLWLSTDSNKAWSNTKVLDCPNMMFYPLSQAQTSHSNGVEQFLEQPGINTLGVNTSLTIGLTFAAYAGFSNIILHGISFSDKYAFDEEVYPNTSLRKVHTYGLYQKSIHPRLWTGLADRYVNVWGTDDVPLDVLRMASPEILLDSIKYSQAFNRAANSIHGISEPVEDKIAEVTKAQELRDGRLTATIMADKVDELLEKWPKRLKGKDIVDAARVNLEAALAQPGGCSDCAKNKLMAPALVKFAEAAAKGEGKARSPINQLWKKVFPDNLNVMHGKKCVIHPIAMEESK